MTQFSDLLGQTLIEIRNLDDQINFDTAAGKTYKMWHRQDCCESVYIEDICGDLNDLIGNPILLAEEVTYSRDELPIPIETPEWVDDDELWTFYKLSTIKASVTIRWSGSSNGYYSVSVDFDEV